MDVDDKEKPAGMQNQREGCISDILYWRDASHHIHWGIVLEGCISSYTLGYCIGGMHLLMYCIGEMVYFGLLYWRDASLDYSGVLYWRDASCGIHWAIVLERCIS